MQQVFLFGNGVLISRQRAFLISACSLWCYFFERIIYHVADRGWPLFPPAEHLGLLVLLI
jgi:hypothetical protein